MNNKDFSDYIRSIEALDENIDKAEMYAKSIYHLEASLVMWKNNLELIAVTEMRNAVTNLIGTLKTGLSLLLKE